MCCLFIEHLYNIPEKRKLEKWKTVLRLLGPRVGRGRMSKVHCGGRKVGRREVDVVMKEQEGALYMSKMISVLIVVTHT